MNQIENSLNSHNILNMTMIHTLLQLILKNLKCTSATLIDTSNIYLSIDLTTDKKYLLSARGV